MHDYEICKVFLKFWLGNTLNSFANAQMLVQHHPNLDDLLSFRKWGILHVLEEYVNVRKQGTLNLT